MRRFLCDGYVIEGGWLVVASAKKQSKLVLTGTPNPRQIEFFNCTARHIAYGGARG